MRRLGLFVLFLINGFLTSSARAAEVWTSTSPTYNQAILYKSMYVASNPPSSYSLLFPATRFYTSTNTFNWTLQSERSQLTSNFAILNNMLYMIGTESAGGIYTAHLFESSDGIQWTQLNGALPSDIYRSLIAFNGNLYAAGLNAVLNFGRIDPLTGQWTAVNAVGTATVLSKVFNNELYVVNVPQANRYQLLRSADGSTWQTVGSTFSTLSTTWNLVEFNGELYWPNDSILKTAGGASSEIMADITGTYMFVLNGVLHARGSNSTDAIRALIDGQWRVVSSASLAAQSLSFAAQVDPVIVVGDRAHVVVAGIESKLGLYSLTSGSVVSGEFSAGQVQATFLRWTARFNLSETITAITVQNLGTAVGTRDLTNLKILSAPTGTSTLSLVSNLDIVPGSTQTWHTPGGFNLTVYDDLDFYLVGDIAASPLDLATVNFSLPADGMTTTINESYDPPAITAGSFQVINAGSGVASGNVVGVVGYPSPARDELRFMYTLSNVSDVRIDVYDRSGRQVATLTETGKAAAARATSLLDSSSLAAGVYYALTTIRSSDGEQRHKTKIVIEK